MRFHVLLLACLCFAVLAVAKRGKQLLSFSVLFCYCDQSLFGLHYRRFEMRPSRKHLDESELGLLVFNSCVH